jgi:CheY-like chemotaxis protein
VVSPGPGYPDGERGKPLLTSMAHMLLVEDDPDLRQLLQDVIAAAGHTADCVMTKQEAVYLLAPQVPRTRNL